jgi:hypothetical protein
MDEKNNRLLSQSKSSHRLTAMRSQLHRAAASHHASTKLGRDDRSIGVCCCSGQGRRRYFQATTRKRRGRGGQTWRSGGDTRQTPSCGQARQVGRGAALARPTRTRRRIARQGEDKPSSSPRYVRRDARRKPNPVCRGNLEMQDLDDGISQLSSASRASMSTRTPTSAKLDRAVSARRLSSTGSKPPSTHVCPPAADRDIQYNSTPGTYVSWRVHTDADSGWCAFVRDLCCAGMHPYVASSSIACTNPDSIISTLQTRAQLAVPAANRAPQIGPLFCVASIVLLLVERVSDASPTT